MKIDQKRRVGYTRYSSAGAFEQQRLDKYIMDVASGNYSYGGRSVFPSGYSGGVFGSTPVPAVGISHALALEDNTQTTNAISWSTKQQIGTLIALTAPTVVTVRASGLYQLNYVVAIRAQLAAGYTLTTAMDVLTSGHYYYTNYLRKQSADLAPQKIYNICTSVAHWFASPGTITYTFDGGSSGFSEIAWASIIKLY